MWSRVDAQARRVVAVPFLLAGIGLSHVSEWAIRLGAWIADIETEHR